VVGDVGLDGGDGVFGLLLGASGEEDLGGTVLGELEDRLLAEAGIACLSCQYRWC
jgi:hypothetical protein